MADIIHILGLGGVGILVAHALAGVPDRPPLNLLLHRPREHHSRLLALSRDGATEYQSDFSLEQYRDGCWYQEASRSSVQPMKHTLSQRIPSNETPINFLLVAVKAHLTIDLIRHLKHRLSKSSTILFLQNGMGVLDELDDALFPDPSERPYYMSAIVTHCVRREGFLFAVHTVMGSITLGTSPRIPRVSEAPISLQPPPGVDKLVGILNRTCNLNVSFLSPRELLRQQLTKLATNSIYNPLTSLLECSVNGVITSKNPRVQAMSDALVCEFSSIIEALPLLELTGKEDFETDFSPANLRRTIYQVGLRAGEHTTSMLQDIKHGVKTEIMYLNGYFTWWALNLGIESPVNDAVTWMVLEKEKRAAGK